MGFVTNEHSRLGESNKTSYVRRLSVAAKTSEKCQDIPHLGLPILGTATTAMGVSKR